MSGTVTLCVDSDRCEGHGQCVFVAPELLSLEDDGSLTVLQPDVTDHLELAERAAAACPTSALVLQRASKS